MTVIFYDYLKITLINNYIFIKILSFYLKFLLLLNYMFL